MKSELRVSLTPKSERGLLQKRLMPSASIVRSAGRSIPEYSSSRSSIRSPSRSSAIDSTGTGISSPPNTRAYRSRSACARGST